MTTFHIGDKSIHELRREANVFIPKVNPVIATVKKYSFHEDRSPRLEMRSCTREGWDDEENRNEACGAHFSQGGCGCHPSFCPDCSAETHGLSITLPGVMESSSLMNHCTTKGNHG